MKFLKISLLSIVIAAMSGCGASGYKSISPGTLNYVSTNVKDGVRLEYKYDLLDNKYEKKETKKGVKLVAINITNNTDRDLIFGKDIILGYENGEEALLMEHEKTFTNLKQNAASNLLFLLITPLNLTITKPGPNGAISHYYPVGLMLGPTLAGGNMIAAGSANQKFKKDLMEHNLLGILIKKGETKDGLIGIKTDSYDALQPILKTDPETETKSEIAP